MDYLLFRLYGPFCAWGTIAVGEARPSANYPTKSAIIGLIAAALGLRRDDEVSLAAVADGYGMAVLVNSAGTLLTDYHTAEVPRSGQGRNHRDFYTRRDEILAVQQQKKEHSEGAILSLREYRQDAWYTILLWSRANAPYSLQILQQRLQAPVFTLYLGRKSCPPAVPLEPQIHSAESITAALAKANFQAGSELMTLVKNTTVSLYWDEDGIAGTAAAHVFTQRDQALSRRRWQFHNRREYQASYQL